MDAGEANRREVSLESARKLIEAGMLFIPQWEPTDKFLPRLFLDVNDQQVDEQPEQILMLSIQKAEKSARFYLSVGKSNVGLREPRVSIKAIKTKHTDQAEDELAHINGKYVQFDL